MNQIMNFSNPKDALEWATIISKTKGFCPKAYWDKPYDILCAIQYGHELGVTPMQSIQGVAVINGQPAVYGDLLLALCRASPHFEWCNETFDVATLTATCIAKRKDQPEVIRTFDKQKAINAQLWGQLNYKKYPERMLQMRARSFALRDAFADVLKGVIAVEEAADFEPIKDVELEKACEIDAIKELEKQIDIQDLYLDLVNLISLKNISNEEVQKWLKKAGVNCLNDLPYGIVQKIIEYLEKLEVSNGV